MQLNQRTRESEMAVTPTGIDFGLNDAIKALCPDVSIACDAHELEAILRLRYEVIYQEQGKNLGHLDHDHKIIHDGDESTLINLFIKREGDIVGAVRVSCCRLESVSQQLRDFYSLDRFADFVEYPFLFGSRAVVSRSFRATEVAIELARAVYVCGRVLNCRFCFAHCPPPLFTWYERLGARRYKADEDVPALGARTPHAIILDDNKYLESIRSPLAKVLHDWAGSAETSEWFQRQFGRAGQQINKE